jgi:hypothetical protein
MGIRAYAFLSANDGKIPQVHAEQLDAFSLGVVARQKLHTIVIAGPIANHGVHPYGRG